MITLLEVKIPIDKAVASGFIPQLTSSFLAGLRLEPSQSIVFGAEATSEEYLWTQVRIVGEEVHIAIGYPG